MNARQWLPEAAQRCPLGPKPSVDQRRRRLSCIARTFGSPIGPGSVERALLPTPSGPLGVSIYSPGAPTNAVIVYFHGGGWCLGGADSHGHFCALLATMANSKVVLVEYRLAPEHPFPAAVIDAVESVLAIARGALTQVGRVSRLRVAGDSAGANLATVCASELRTHELIDEQILLVPQVDTDNARRASAQEYGYGDFGLSVSDIAWYVDTYHAGQSVTRRDPRAAPLLSQDLAGLPPATVVTAECDPLRDEGEEYVAALRAAGNAVRHWRVPEMFHAFLYFGGVLPEVSEVCRWVAAPPWTARCP